MRYYLTDDIVPVVPFCLKIQTYVSVEPSRSISSSREPCHDGAPTVNDYFDCLNLRFNQKKETFSIHILETSLKNWRSVNICDDVSRDVIYYPKGLLCLLLLMNASCLGLTSCRILAHRLVNMIIYRCILYSHCIVGLHSSQTLHITLTTIL